MKWRFSADAAFALHGVQPGDLVMVTYSLGLGNGGMAPREAIWRYTGAVPVMTGSGARRRHAGRSRSDKAWGVNVILELSVLPATSG